MGIQSTMFTAVSGLNSSSRTLTEIGNNIANSGTVSFKARSVMFGDLINTALEKKMTKGRGVQVVSVRSNFAQGSLQRTQNVLDLSIDGLGFFQVRDPNAIAGGVTFTRAGQFSVDKNGFIVDPNRLILQGYLADATGAITGQIGDLKVKSTPISKITTAIKAQVNLDSNQTTNTFSLANPVGTSNFSTSLTVYDSIGNQHLLTIYFSKTAANTWAYNVVAAAAEVTSTQEVGGNARVASGTLTFNTSGALTGTTGPTYYNSGASGIDFDGATANQAIGLDFTGSSQLAASSSVIQLSQDGSPAGLLTGVFVDSDGRVVGQFTNGLTQNLGQLALARFANPDGLVAQGRNLFSASAQAGEAQVGTAGSGALGRVVPGALELSNVDLGEEFINMITAQRMFQANSRVISTTDEMLQELVNLKR